MSTPTSARSCHTRVGLVDVGVDAPHEVAVVGERLDRGVGHRVDGVGPDQLVDVQRVRVGLVLRRRARPQRALDLRALRRQRVPAGPGERLAELPVGELALRHGRLAAQRQRGRRPDRVEPPVDLGVDPRDEEAADAGDLRQVGAVGRRRTSRGRRGRRPSRPGSARAPDETSGARRVSLVTCSSNLFCFFSVFSLIARPTVFEKLPGRLARAITQTKFALLRLNCPFD